MPIDNGYLIYSALSRLCPNIHDLNDIGIHPIEGKPNPYKQLKLTKLSKLKIRIPLEQIPSIYQFLEDFAITPQAVKDYQLASENFIDNKIFIKDKNFIVRVNSIRAIIADNLARDLSWWRDLWERLYQTEPLESKDLDKQLVSNRRGLLAMLVREQRKKVG